MIKGINPHEYDLTWAVHNAFVILCNGRKTTVALFPVLNATPTDRSVQLTVKKYFQKVKNLLEGPGSRTVITVDLVLYPPMQQLLMVIEDKHSILLPGDSHIIMVEFRAIGTFIEMTGIPELWVESGVFTDTVASRILDGKPVRRSIAAHVVTLQVMYLLLLDTFFQEHADEGRKCDAAAGNSVNPGKGKTETQNDMHITNYKTN